MALIVAIRASGFNYLQIEVSFTAVTRVQIPSGTPSLFRNLQPIAEIVVGTKRHNSDRIPTSLRCSITTVFAYFEHVFTGTKKHMRTYMPISRRPHSMHATA